MTMLRRSRMRPVAILALVALVASCTRSDAAPAGSIDAKELAAQVAAGKAPVILDVRSPEEFAAGHIQGAINVPVGELADRLTGLELARGEEIVVHCERGPRAAKAETILIESGYTNVRDLSGHMSGWRAAGLPVE